MIWGYHYFGKHPYEVSSMNCHHHQQQHPPPSPGSQLKAFHCWTYHTTSLEGYQLALDIGIWIWGIFPSFTHRWNLELLGGESPCETMMLEIWITLLNDRRKHTFKKRPEFFRMCPPICTSSSHDILIYSHVVIYLMYFFSEGEMGKVKKYTVIQW